MKALDDVGEQISVFVIGVGAEIDPGELRAIGRQGAVLSKNPAEVKAAFDKIAEQVEAYTKSFYLFSYCSPARAAEHERAHRGRRQGSRQGLARVSLQRQRLSAQLRSRITRPSFDVHHPKFRKEPAR